MKFSVLMSVYIKDSPQDLLESFGSLFFQSVPAKQVVLVIDGPITADLESAIDAYSKKLPLDIVRLKNNIGLGNALSSGIQFVTHDWVFRMDSDDICRFDRFEKQVEFIKKNDVDVFGGAISEFIRSPSEPVSIRKVPLDNEGIYKSFGYFSPFNHVTVAFKKDVVLSVGGYSGGQGFQEDLFLWLNLAAKNVKFANMPDVLVDVRVGDDMLSRRGGLTYYINEIKVLNHALNLNLITKLVFYRNVFLKGLLRLSPLFLRRIIYSYGRRLMNK